MSDERDTTEIIQEIRRQGRAAVAAQAAAEACLDAIAVLRAPDGEEASVGDDRERDLVRALLPLADALDRVADQTSNLASTAEPPGRVQRWLGVRAAGPDLASLANAVTLLRAQLADALDVARVTIDRRTGVPIDGDAHRVVGTKRGPAGQVVEVVRPGYTHRGVRVREADVIAGKSGDER